MKIFTLSLFAIFISLAFVCGFQESYEEAYWYGMMALLTERIDTIRRDDL